jgi:predicted enzyme related to lactoylglutathione lyase
MNHLANWIEIPVANLARAKKFYAEILNVELNDMQIGDVSYSILSVKDQFNCGALASGPSCTPSSDGVVVYLNGGDDLSKVLGRVKKAGGKVLIEKTFLSKEAGHIALFVRIPDDVNIRSDDVNNDSGRM